MSGNRTARQGTWKLAEEESELLGVAIRRMLYGKGRGIHRPLFSIQYDVVTLHYVRHAS